MAPGPYLNEQFRVLQSGLTAVRSNVNDVRRDMEIDRVRENRRYNIILGNIQRIRIQPAAIIQQHQQGNNNANNFNNDTNPPAPGLAVLSPHPRSLYLLWQEFMEGIGG